MNCTTDTDLATFLDALGYEPGDLIELRPIPHDSEHPHGRGWYTPSQLSAMNGGITRLNQRQSIYFGVNPRTQSGGGSRADVACCRAVFADFDGLPLAEVMRRIEDAGLPHPTVIVESGGGFHVYWTLADPIDPDLFEQIQRGLIAVLDSDPKVCDAPRIMRLPGTVNRKPERDNALCTVVELNDERHDIESIIMRFPEPAAEAPTTKPTSDDNRIERARRYVAKMPAAVSGQGGHNATFHVACVLFRFGLDDTDARRLLTEYSARCQPPWSARELDHKIESAKAEVAAKGEFCAWLADDRPRTAVRDSTAQRSAPDNGTAAKGLTRTLADKITAEHHFAQDAGNKLYEFSDGVYRPTGERFVKRRVKRILNERGESKKWSLHIANEVVGYISVDAPELWESPPVDTVNVRNGLLDVTTRTLRPHDPVFLSPVQLPIEFDEAATCPHWDRFIEDVFPADAIEVAYEIVAWLMLPDTTKQVAVILLGEGSNGKSVYLMAVTNLIGRSNVAAVSLHRLESDRFSVARLVGKLANVCPDLPSEALKSTSSFKALTGGDVMLAERKFQESFEFEPFARPVFSANHPPRSADASAAFFRRWIVVPFNRTFEPGGDNFTPRDVLDARLADPAEFSGVLNRALDVLPRLRADGFTISASMEAAASEFRQTTDPLTVWLEATLIEHSNAITPKNDLLKTYNLQTVKHGTPRISPHAMTKGVKAAYPHADEGQRMVNGRATWCWLGIGLAAPEDRQ